MRCGRKGVASGYVRCTGLEVHPSSETVDQFGIERSSLGEGESLGWVPSIKPTQR